MAKRNKTEAKPKPEAELEDKETESRDDDADVAELQDGDPSAAADAEADKALQLLEPDAAEAERPRRRAPGAPLSTVRDQVGRFLAEAKRYPRLSETEERALGVAARERGDLNAARTLVVHNLRLVISIAYQYRRA